MNPFSAPAAIVTTAALIFAGAGSALADPPDFTTTIGIPNLAAGGRYRVGAVDNQLRTGGGQVLTERQLGLGGPVAVANARFGAAIVTGDLNGDGFQDMIVGAPGTPGASAQDVPGRVDVLFGGGPDTGIETTGATSVSTPALPGDEFGAALDISPRFELDRPFTGTKDLWIGAPGHDVDGKADAGAVFRYSIGPTGVVTYLETITQDSPLIPGVAEAGDRFGEVLAGDNQNGVMVGMPHEDVGTLKDAGTVQRIRTDTAADTLVPGEDWGQNAPGVPGVAEAGDRFGASMSDGGRAVGAPGEDVGRVKDAGEVQTFGFSYAGVSGLDVVPSAVFTQDSPGVPGKAEAGDRFGAAISEGVFACQERLSAAIGAPGEDIGSIKDAGSITLVVEPFYTGLPGACGAQAFSQGSGLPGTAETGDQVGAAMGVLQGDPFDEEDKVDQVQTGAPGEDIGSIKDAGRVISGTGKSASSLAPQGGDISGMRFGSVFSTHAG